MVKSEGHTDKEYWSVEGRMGGNPTVTVSGEEMKVPTGRYERTKTTTGTEPTVYWSVYREREGRGCACAAWKRVNGKSAEMLEALRNSETDHDTELEFNDAGFASL